MMSFHTETYEHNGLPVYVFPAVDHDAVGNKVATIACPFLGEYPQLHSKSSIHKRKVFSDVGCGGFTRSMENHARDKTSCGRMFKKPCYLQAADGPLKLYDPTASLDTKSDDEDKENRDPNIRVSERSTTARKVVKDSVKSASEQLLYKLEEGVNEIFMRALSQDAAMDVDADTLYDNMAEIIEGGRSLRKELQARTKELEKLTRVQGMLAEIKCDCPKLEADVDDVQMNIETLQELLDSRKYSYAQQAYELQTLFAEAHNS